MTTTFRSDNEISLNTKATISNINTSLPDNDVEIMENKANDILSQNKQIYLSFKTKHIQRNMQTNVLSLTKQLKNAQEKIAELQRLLQSKNNSYPSQSDFCVNT
eukprot:318879_1